MRIITYAGPADLAAGVAETVSEAIEAKSGRFSLGLAGGSSPEATYLLCRGFTIDWAKVTGWLADERWVPHDSNRSNGRLAATALFDHVEARLLRPAWSPDMSPEGSAADYAATLDGLRAEAGRHDLILLGLGEDGHTASLFPGSEALGETTRTYVANQIPETGEIRLTATYPLLHRAKRIVFLVQGERKAEALAASLAGDTPAGIVDEGEAEVEWHADEAAASLLS